MVEKEKKCIGIIFGGESNEHDISVSSAKTVFKAFISKTNINRFWVKAFYINKHGVWLDNDQSRVLLKEKTKNENNRKQRKHRQHVKKENKKKGKRGEPTRKIKYQNIWAVKRFIC